MRNIFQIFTLIILLNIGFTVSGCFEDDQYESRYVGGWRIERYYDSGNDLTGAWLQSHRDYNLFLKPDHLFSEGYMLNSGPYRIDGTWSLSHDRKLIILQDEVNGTREYEIRYMFTLYLKMGKEEWILRKL